MKFNDSSHLYVSTFKKGDREKFMEVSYACGRRFFSPYDYDKWSYDEQINRFNEFRDGVLSGPYRDILCAIGGKIVNGDKELMIEQRVMRLDDIIARCCPKYNIRDVIIEQSCRGLFISVFRDNGDIIYYRIGFLSDAGVNHFDISDDEIDWDDRRCFINDEIGLIY